MKSSFLVHGHVVWVEDLILSHKNPFSFVGRRSFQSSAEKPLAFERA